MSAFSWATRSKKIIRQAEYDDAQAKLAKAIGILTDVQRTIYKGKSGRYKGARDNCIKAINFIELTSNRFESNWHHDCYEKGVGWSSETAEQHKVSMEEAKAEKPPNEIKVGDKVYWKAPMSSSADDDCSMNIIVKKIMYRNISKGLVFIVGTDGTAFECLLSELSKK